MTAVVNVLLALHRRPVLVLCLTLSAILLMGVDWSGPGEFACDGGK